MPRNTGYRIATRLGVGSVQSKPKPKRIKNRAVLDYVVHKRDGICMWGLTHPGEQGPCSPGLDPHHITNRGAGGDDAEENLITLCRWHHDLAQSHRIPAYRATSHPHKEDMVISTTEFEQLYDRA